MFEIEAFQKIFDSIKYKPDYKVTFSNPEIRKVEIMPGEEENAITFALLCEKPLGLDENQKPVPVATHCVFAIDLLSNDVEDGSKTESEVILDCFEFAFETMERNLFDCWFNHRGMEKIDENDE